jgi:hypothetical protein
VEKGMEVMHGMLYTGSIAPHIICWGLQSILNILTECNVLNLQDTF